MRFGRQVRAVPTWAVAVAMTLGLLVGVSDTSAQTASAAVPSVTVWDADLVHPTSITAGPDGALWFTESNSNKIGRITTGAAPSPSATIPTLSFPMLALLGLSLAGLGVLLLKRL